jgi:SAM-dependent methyltransferase
LIYRALALVADWPGAIDFALATKQITLDLAARLGIGPGRLLDLACGTGTFAIEMANAGWQVTGLDISPAMIARAEAKAQVLGDRAPRFYLSDFRTINLPGPFEIVTCFADSLNHLADEAGLTAVFESVRGVIAPGGLFVFDTSTQEAFDALWNDRASVVDTPDFFWATRHSYDPATGRGAAESTIFVRQDDQYLRFDETVDERYFAPTMIADRLRAAGFPDVTREGFSPHPHSLPGDLKDLWIARPG